MMNLINYCLLVGAMGQCWFYGRLFPNVPMWIVLIILMVPWLVVHVVTFCNGQCLKPQSFRRLLISVMCWYAFVTALAEVIHFFCHLPSDGNFTVTAARILMYGGGICFIPFIDVCIFIRHQDSSRAA